MNCYKTYVIGILDSILGIINYETVGILWNPNGFALFKLNNVTAVQPGASDAVLIGRARYGAAYIVILDIYTVASDIVRSSVLRVLGVSA